MKKSRRRVALPTPCRKSDYATKEGVEVERRPDSQVTVRFKMHDIPGTITDSASEEGHLTLIECLDKLQAYDVAVEYEIVTEKGLEYQKMETSELLVALEKALPKMNTREELKQVIAMCRHLSTRPIQYNYQRRRRR